MSVCSDLWAVGIRAEFGYKANQNFKTDIIGFAQDQGIPILVLFGEAELAGGNVNVKDMAEQKQLTVPRAELTKTVLGLLANKADGVLS
jgi:histidyl-tRNA synthetase